MMPWNLLLLPLLGGFVFASWFRLTKYSAQRSDGHRLLFYAALSGAGLLFLAVIVQTSFRYRSPALYTQYAESWDAVTTIPYSATATLAFLLSVPLGLVGMLIPRNKALEWAIKGKGDPFELLLQRSIQRRKMVSITVSNGKFYVGYITTTPNPGQSMEVIGLIPQLSGYRREADKTLQFTTNYMTAQDAIRDKLRVKYDDEIRSKPNMKRRDRRKLTRQLERELELKDFELIIPVSEIQSMNIFDPDIYEDHFKTQAVREETESSVTNDGPSPSAPPAVTP